MAAIKLLEFSLRYIEVDRENKYCDGYWIYDSYAPYGFPRSYLKNPNFGI